MSKIVILASGTGSNANKIIQHFRNTPVEISLIASNNKNAGVLNIASDNNIDTYIINRSNFETDFINTLEEINPDLIILAGFLWKIPQSMVNTFSNKIINIHPSLLPKFGGKGMYGHFVHEAVFNSKEKESGITIHYVNENYDEGQIIKQFKVDILETDTPNDIESKVRRLEIENFAKTIEEIL
jgi:phosphoribosylglycinamide formyltransferase-1